MQLCFQIDHKSKPQKDHKSFLNKLTNKLTKENNMFKFELPSYEDIKKNTEQYSKDCQKFWSDFFKDMEKTLKDFYNGEKK